MPQNNILFSQKNNITNQNIDIIKFITNFYQKYHKRSNKVILDDEDDIIYHNNNITNQSTNNKIKIAVALSGGADSMCLLALMIEASKIEQWEIYPIIVDHQLREESTKEAETVQKYVKENFGLECKIIKWERQNTHSIKTNIMAQARNARYQILINECISENIDILCTGHNANDQAETVIQRMLFGSGASGIGGIKQLLSIKSQKQDKIIHIIRPILHLSRDQIELYLKKCNISWINDPSNENENFDRIKVRKNINSIASLFSTEKHQLIKKLCILADNCQQNSNFIEKIANKNFKKLAEYSPNGAISINLHEFSKLDQIIGKHIILLLLKNEFYDESIYILKNTKRISSEQINYIYDGIINKSLKKITIHNKFIIVKQNRIIAFYEPGKNIQYDPAKYKKDLYSNDEVEIYIDLPNQNLWNEISQYNFIKKYSFNMTNTKWFLTKDIMLSMPWLFVCKLHQTDCKNIKNIQNKHNNREDINKCLYHYTSCKTHKKYYNLNTTEENRRTTTRIIGRKQTNHHIFHIKALNLNQIQIQYDHHKEKIVEDIDDLEQNIDFQDIFMEGGVSIDANRLFSNPNIAQYNKICIIPLWSGTHIICTPHESSHN